jgi:hypothetical protein
LSNREIASCLGLTEHTVKNYLFRIFDKLGVSSRVEVVLYVFRFRKDWVAAPSSHHSSARASGPKLLTPVRPASRMRLAASPSAVVARI